MDNLYSFNYIRRSPSYSGIVSGLFNKFCILYKEDNLLQECKDGRRKARLPSSEPSSYYLAGILEVKDGYHHKRYVMKKSRILVQLYVQMM
jgi:hypothetical protein